MASLHKDPRSKSPYWYVSYRTPDRKQHFRSTKETSRDKAESFAAAIDESLDRAKVGSFTETAARSILSDLYRKINGNALQFTSIQAWLDTCLRGVKKLRGETTHKRYESVVAGFLEFIGPQRAKAPLESLTSDEIQRFADARFEEGRAAKTIQNDLKPIAKFLKDAERKGVLLRSPMGSVELPETEGETRDPFSESELSSLLNHLSATKDAEGKPLSVSERAYRRDWQTAVNLGLYMGARLGDATNLRWSNVDYTRKQIRFIPEKSRKKRELVIPIHPDLEAYLLTLPSSDKADGFLCPTLGGAEAGHRASLSRNFGNILESAGIDRRPGKKKHGKGRTFYRLGFHALRHTFNSMMADAGVSIELRSKLTGHSTLAMNDRYTHLADATKRRAIDSIPSLLRPRT
ncbi:MAG: site-specific integrase [Opitutaceae bacterium]|jgi:integrase